MNTQRNLLTTGVDVREVSQDEQLIVNGGNGACYSNRSGQRNPRRIFFSRRRRLAIAQRWENGRYKNDMFFGSPVRIPISTDSQFVRFCNQNGYQVIRFW